MTYQKLIVPIDHGNRNLRTMCLLPVSLKVTADLYWESICIITADTMHCLTSVFHT